MSKRLKFSAFTAFAITLLLVPILKVGLSTQYKQLVREQSEIQTITPDELHTGIEQGDDDLVIIDVRSLAEYENAHIPKSIHIPLNTLEEDSKRLDKNDDFVLFCGALTCGASDTAARKLHDLGFPSLFVLEGGFPAWENGRYPVESGACPFHSGVEESSFWKDCMDLGIVIAAGITDGINPCAIGMMLFLLGYLVIFAEEKKKVLPIGMTYVASVFTTYFVVGMILYGTVNTFISNPFYIRISEILKIIIAEILIIAGVLNIKDYFFRGNGFTLGIPDSAQPKLKQLATKATIPTTALLGVLVTLFETPCSLPIYVGTLEVLGRRLSLGWEVFGLIGLYNLLFVLPLIIILLMVVKGVQMVKLKEWEHQNRYRMKLIMGAGIVILSIIMLFI